MDDFKGTPGPWRACVDWHAGNRPRRLDTDDVTTADGQEVCRMAGNVTHAVHDARLIAAAPTMLAVLEAVAACPLLHDENGHAYLKVDARAINGTGAAVPMAIAMAKGESK